VTIELEAALILIRGHLAFQGDHLAGIQDGLDYRDFERCNHSHDQAEGRRVAAVKVINKTLKKFFRNS